jgi:hypothetical protein
VTAAAPRLDPRLVSALGRIDDPALPIAETWRRTGRLAESLGVPRPSYEHIRRRIRPLRRRPRLASTVEIAGDVLWQSRPPAALVDLLTGDRPASRDGA